MRELFRKFEKYMVAATFAEAGEHKTAMDLLLRLRRKRRRQRPEPRVQDYRPRPELRASPPKD